MTLTVNCSSVNNKEKEMKQIITILIAGFILGLGSAEAQILKKLRKRAEQAAEETIYRKVEEKTSEETEKAMDTLINAPGKKLKKRKNKGSSESQEDYDEDDAYEEGAYEEGFEEVNPALEVYSKFDFVPGDKTLFYDDFGQDFIGDFPANWNTNGSGEIVRLNDQPQKWLKLLPGYGTVYIPDVPELPEDYTVEFDVVASGLDRNTTSTAVLKVGVSDDPTFKWGRYASVDIPFCQYSPVGFYVRNGGAINNSIEGDIRDKVLGQAHISIAVNQQRFRLWVDETKYVDIPRMIPEGAKPSNIKFELRQFKDGKENLFISNLKVAEGGVDLRRKLLAEGEISTNGILFESGSATLQPQSMGIIRQISQVLNEDQSISLNIIGHTDADGEEEDNLILSEARASAVKNALVSVYGIEDSRLTAEGRGELEPLTDNNSPEGKAQNRRVVFTKI